MRAFLKKVIIGNGVTPPEICAKSFSENFSDAVNVEWHIKQNSYEVIFYRQSQEHIAIFSFDGSLLEYKQNLPVEYLPLPIKEAMSAKGEIMNAVLFNKGNMLEYEFVVRDRFLKRHLVVVSDLGKVKEERGL